MLKVKTSIWIEYKKQKSLEYSVSHKLKSFSTEISITTTNASMNEYFMKISNLVFEIQKYKKRSLEHSVFTSGFPSMY